jgi:hypothetical protein
MHTVGSRHKRDVHAFMDDDKRVPGGVDRVIPRVEERADEPAMGIGPK